VLVVLEPVFVAHHLAVEFVYQLVHSSVQIFTGALGKQIVAFDMDIALCALTTLLLLLVFDR
jgi:hypothetical protein